MSQLLYKYFIKKTNMDHVFEISPSEDPYYEEVPENELHFYQRKGARRWRKLPEVIPANDLKILESVKREAYRLDLQLSMCGLRFGWAGVIGLLPWIGDVICLYFAMQILYKADKIQGGLPVVLRLEMMANIILDFCFGLVPILGDFINVLYRCNSRNFILLEKHLVKKYSKVPASTVSTKPMTDSSKPAARVENDKINQVKPNAHKLDKVAQLA